MKKQERMVSLVVGTTMLLSSVTFISGCGKGNSSRKISGSSDWFESKVTECKTGHEDADISYSSIDNTFFYDGYIYGIYFANLNVSNEDMMDPNFDYSSSVINELLKFDTDGNLVKTFNLNDIIQNGYINSTSVSENGLDILYYSYDMDTGASTDLMATINLEDGSLSEPIKTPFEYNSENQSLIKTINLSNGALLGAICTWENEYSFIFEICEDGAIVKTIDFAKDYSLSIYDIPVALNDDNGNLVFVAATDKGNITYTLDIKTYEVKANTDSSSSTPMDFTSYSTATDGNMYTVDEEGIKKLNNRTFESETALSFEDCNVNLYDITYLQVLDVTDEGYVLAGSVNTSVGMQYISAFKIYKLTKADKNPNAGKTRLIIGEVNGYVDASMAEAIYQFNETSEDYFASVKLYDTDMDYSEEMTDEEFEMKTMTATASMTNELAIELMSGDGPDVIMDAASIAQLNSKDYLKDLTPITDKLSSDDYFTNVIDAAKTGDTLYQLPLSFIAEGISCDKKYAPSNGTGFTIPEYKELVFGPCNGKDPIEISRSMYFLRGISMMSDLFIDPDNRKVDFKQDAFYDFAEYCLENVPEEIVYDDEDSMGMDYIEEIPAASWTYMSGLANYASITGNGTVDYGFYGVSSDGRGPCMEVYSSVAVSATTKCEDGAYEFINILLSDDIQYKSAIDYANCINKNALRKACVDSIETTNKMYDLELSYGIPETQLAAWGYARVDESMIDGYFECLDSTSNLATIDPSVSLIILEEVSAYFNGQKSIEDVAELINNRAQTVMNER